MTQPTHGLDPNALEAALSVKLVGQFWPGETAIESEDHNWSAYRAERYAQIITAYLAALSQNPGTSNTSGEAVGVRVKPLRWLDVGTPSELDLIAHTPFDTFQISRDDTCEWPIVLRPFITSQSNYQTVEEAKAAAEAEFERRILSTLASSERSGREADAKVASDALTVILSQLPKHINLSKEALSAVAAIRNLAGTNTK
jgi:hypothetical protein